MSALPRLVHPLVLISVTALALGGCGSSGGGGGDPSRDGGPGVDSGFDDAGNAYFCGDGLVTGNERCDDRNTADDDGCAGDCSAIEENYACPAAGMACVRIVTCGNGRVEGSETCDDGDTGGGDGCSSTCELEEGWTCVLAGTACVATECGDGFVAGFEICDDMNNPMPGCDANCELEEGYHCPTPGAVCATTTCGDGLTQGTEECDDQNLAVGDGCTPFCKQEPNCSDGSCVAVCGDGIVWAPEECDDGNTQDGDGCAGDCSAVEQGFLCTEVVQAAPTEVDLPVTYRDFIAACDGTGSYDGRLEMGEGGAAVPYGHRDFQCFNGAETGMVLTMLDGERKPVRSMSATKIDSDASFANWYRDDSDYNLTRAGFLTLPRYGSGMPGDPYFYQFADTTFYPLSGSGFDQFCDGVSAPPCESTYANATDGAGPYNFHFTSEVHYWFEYNGSEVLDFYGDDDVWVFINGRLAVDIGGVHGSTTGSITLSDCAGATLPPMNPDGCPEALDLMVGGIYEAVVFQAERHTTRSQYQLTLTNFNRAPSVCDDDCGDGIVSSREQCDLMGLNEDPAPYDGCSTACQLGPYCGDGITNGAEVCDDGINLGGDASACSPGCLSMGAACGDGVVQVDEGEECDDGNTVSLDGCSDVCKLEIG